MNRDIQRQTEQLNKKRLLRQRWHRWFSVPACAVVFVTAYALILPAITLDTAPDTYCGQEEHIHTDECYEIPGVPEHTVIDCPVQQELHIHNWFVSPDWRTGTAAPQDISRRYSKQKYYKKRKE